jgi:predicted Zn-dependent peptidase
MHPDLRLDLQQFTLDNGLKLLVSPMPYARTAAFSLVVRVGSRHDPPERQGLTHLLEHMLFRGTGRLEGPREVNAALESHGAPLSASVLRDQTIFEMPTFPEALPDALMLLGEMFTQPRFADLDIERDVVLQERLDEVDERGRPKDVDNLAMRSLFPSDGLGWSIIGTRRSIRTIRVDDLRAHLQGHYTGRNMILAVAGPVSPEAIRQAVERALGDLPAGERVAALPATPRADLPAVAMISEDDSQADFDLTFLTAKAAHPDAEALDVIVRLLDDGASSRIRARLCDDLGLAYEVGVHQEIYADVGLMRVTGAVAPERLTELVREVGRELADLRKRPVPSEELERVRGRVMFDLLAALDSPESLSSWLAEEALYRSVDELPESLRRLLELGSEDLRQVASRYFGATRAQLAVVGDMRRDRRRLERALGELG